MIKYSLGIDIAKNDLHCCLSLLDAQQGVSVKRSGSFKNNLAGFKELEKWIKATCRQKEVPLSITMEATGVYYENCALFLFARAYRVSVVLPNKAKKYIEALGVKTKNDKADAKALSRMGAEQVLENWQPMGEFFYKLRSLTRHHQCLQEMRTSLTNQAAAAALCMYENEAVIRSLQKMIQVVEQQIQDNAIAISVHLASDEAVAGKVKNLLAIKGVGELTVAVIVAETNGFELFESLSQLVSYAGYDVIENQSGKHTGKTKISKKGNSRIRRALHMPALCVVTHEVKVFKDLYERTLKKHGIKMKSYVAVQKKLLAILYTLWKKNEKFDEHYSAKNTTKDEEVVPSSRFSFEEAV
jgi:transposase